MFYRFSNWISSNANGKLVLVFLVLLLFFNLWVFPFFSRQFGQPPEQPILDLMFGFSPEQAFSIISAYGQAGRSGAILSTAIADSIYPFVYAGLLALAISWFLKAIPIKNKKWQYLNLLPFAALDFDFIENAGIITMLAGYPNQFEIIARIASVAGMLKWSMVVVSMAVLIIIIFLGRIRPLFFKNANTKPH